MPPETLSALALPLWRAEQGLVPITALLAQLLYHPPGPLSRGGGRGGGNRVRQGAAAGGGVRPRRTQAGQIGQRFLPHGCGEVAGRSPHQRICAALDATPDAFLVGTARSEEDETWRDVSELLRGLDGKRLELAETFSAGCGSRNCRGEAGKPRRRPDIYSLFTKKTRIGLIYKV